MRLELRDDQRRAVERVLAALDRRPILVAPTGSGKTVMATALVERLGVRTLWLAHRKELIEQAAGRLAAHGLTCGVILAGCAPLPLAQVQIASVQTLVRRAPPPADLLVIDECHRAIADGYRTILAAYPTARVVGLTATPFRLDGRGLGDLFGELVVAAHCDELCAAGVLHQPKVWASESPDLRGVRVIGGDYSRGALAERVNRPELHADIVATWQQHAAGRRTVAFAVDVAHSQAIAAAFRAAGVPAEHVDGRTYERDTVLARLARGETLVVSNCMVLTEGWDLPALECAILARPTASLNLHLQMIGRIMRAAEGKHGAIVLDHAGNHHVHGLVTRRLAYTLDGERVGHREPLGLRRCQHCGLLFELHAAACPDCGRAPAAPGSGRAAADVHGPGELSAFDDTRFEYRRQVWNLLEAERVALGYKPGWSVYRFTERFGVRPVVANGELVDPPHATSGEKRTVYEQLLATARERGFIDGWAAHRYREMFGCWPRGFVGEVRLERLREKFDHVQSA